MLVLCLALCGCTALRTATAPVGSRPGVDVPSQPETTSDVRLGTPALAPAGQGGYAFSRYRTDGSPVTFDPCRAVHYVVRPDQEPAGGRDLLRSALADVSAATGLQFIDDGETDEVPVHPRPRYQRDRYGDRWAPVLMAWSSPAETDLLAGEVLGSAGPASHGDADSLRYVSGLAVFNAPAIDAQLRLGEDQKARAVVLHEMGHLVGLAHVGDPFQVMFDTNTYPLASFRAGDRRGLEQLGLGPCYDVY